MRVLVCGGRDYYNKILIKKTLDELHAKQPITCIIHGGDERRKRGADFLAKHWAKAIASIPDEPYPADWGNEGRSAGPKRNAKMLLEGKPDLVVAFPGGAGTRDMTKRARAAGLTVIEVKDESWIPK